MNAEINYDIEQKIGLKFIGPLQTLSNNMNKYSRFFVSKSQSSFKLLFRFLNTTLNSF